MKPTLRTKSIAVVLLPNFNALATTAFLDPFRAANYLRGPDTPPDAQYRWRFLCLSDPAEDGVTASNGMEFRATPIQQIGAEKFDLIVISASWTPERYRDPKLFAWLRRQASHGAALAGLDTGAFVLGFAGLLDGFEATVHYEHLSAFRELFPHVAVSDRLYEIDRTRATCCGGLAAGDLALKLLAGQHDDAFLGACARYIFKDRYRDKPEPQLPIGPDPIGPGVPAPVAKAIAAMESAFPDSVSIRDVARRTGISQRQLNRLFLKHTGATPIRFQTDLKLHKARGMVTQTDLSILDISVECGFSSPEYMTKCYRERFSTTPSADRVEGRIPFQFRGFPGYALRDGKKGAPNR